jgi:Cu2+-exporting ATPase
MRTLFVTTVLAAVFTVPVAVLAWGEVVANDRMRGGLCFGFATVVQILAIREFYVPAISALIFGRRIEMDMLVVISITAAYTYSVVALGHVLTGNPLDTEGFFETSAMLITLVLLGRLVAAYSRMKAIASVSMRTLQPTTAAIIEDGVTQEIDARLLQYDDVFVVGPHTKVPTDGEVIRGLSEVDESMITGESMPVQKHPGMSLVAGTLNGDGLLFAKLTRLPGRNTVTDIAELVEEASNQKPHVQDLADWLAGWFVPVIFAIAVIVLVAWLGISFGPRSQSAGAAVGASMTYFVAVLAVSCPCALGLAVPMVLVIAGGVGARNGIVIKSGQSTERAHAVTDVVLDKTGTVTSAELKVLVEVVPSARSHPGRLSEILSIAKGLVQDSQHPVAIAVSKHLKAYDAEEGLENVRSIPGAGIEGILNGTLIRAGNPRFLKVDHLDVVSRLLSQGLTTLCVTRDDEVIALFGLRSTIRPEAVAVVKELQSRNINVHLVSGDEGLAVAEVARTLGITPDYVAAHQTPPEKRDYVKRLIDGSTFAPASKAKARKRTVLFCGDGTNDAIAIAQADIGVQIGSSSDLTRASADVILLSHNLDSLLQFLDISHGAYWRIVTNFIWALVYNLGAVVLASGAAVTVRIPPTYAGLGEIVSVVPVILVALTLGLRIRRRVTPHTER